MIGHTNKNTVEKVPLNTGLALADRKAPLNQPHSIEFNHRAGGNIGE